MNNLINERKAISKNNYGNTKTDGASFYKRAGGPSIVNYHWGMGEDYPLLDLFSHINYCIFLCIYDICIKNLNIKFFAK